MPLQIADSSLWTRRFRLFLHSLRDFFSSLLRLVFGLQFCLQLAVRGIFKYGLDAFSPVTARIARTGAVLFKTAAQHDRGFLVGWRPIQDGTEHRCGELEAPLFPQGIPIVKPVIRIPLVAVESFLE